MGERTLGHALNAQWRTETVHKLSVICPQCGYGAVLFGDGGMVCTKCGHCGKYALPVSLPVATDTPTPERLRAWAEWARANWPGRWAFANPMSAADLFHLLADDIEAEAEESIEADALESRTVERE